MNPHHSLGQRISELPNTVWLIGFVSLLNDSASEMLYPLIPLYLSSVLMAGPRALGIIEGVAEATASLLKLFSGVMMDKTQKAKPWIMVGYALAGFGRPLVAFTTTWPGLLLIRFADRVGKGLRSSPRDALLANAVHEKDRGLAYGLHRAMDNAGGVVGPLMATLLLAQGMALQSIFLWALLPALVCLFLTGSIREPQRTKHPIAKTARFSWSMQGLPRQFKLFLMAVALFSLGNSSNLFLLLRAKELGIQQAQIPLLWALVSAVATVFSTPLAGLSDKMGRKPMLLAGYLAYAAFYAAVGFGAAQGIVLWTLFAGFGLFLAATEGVEKALVADLAPEALRGTAFGWFNLTVGVCLLPASFVFGILYEWAGASAAFGFSTACSTLACLLLLQVSEPAEPARSPISVP